MVRIVLLDAHKALAGRDDDIAPGNVYEIAADDAVCILNGGQRVNGIINVHGFSFRRPIRATQ